MNHDARVRRRGKWIPANWDGPQFSSLESEVLYAGKASRRAKPSAWRQPDGLRFRIMKNHLAYQGNDNFVQYVIKEFGLASRADARDFIRERCSVQWLEVVDPQRLFVMEHLALAELQTRFDRG